MAACIHVAEIIEANSEPLSDFIFAMQYCIFNAALRSLDGIHLLLGTMPGVNDLKCEGSEYLSKHKDCKGIAGLSGTDLYALVTGKTACIAYRPQGDDPSDEDFAALGQLISNALHKARIHHSYTTGSTDYIKVSFADSEVTTD